MTRASNPSFDNGIADSDEPTFPIAGLSHVIDPDNPSAELLDEAWEVTG